MFSAVKLVDILVLATPKLILIVESARYYCAWPVRKLKQAIYVVPFLPILVKRQSYVAVRSLFLGQLSFTSANGSIVYSSSRDVYSYMFYCHKALQRGNTILPRVPKTHTSLQRAALWVLGTCPTGRISNSLQLAQA